MLKYHEIYEEEKKKKLNLKKPPSWYVYDVETRDLARGSSLS
jgi:hypothetical protein